MYFSPFLETKLDMPSIEVRCKQTWRRGYVLHHACPTHVRFPRLSSHHLFSDTDMGMRIYSPLGAYYQLMPPSFCSKNFRVEYVEHIMNVHALLISCNRLRLTHVVGFWSVVAIGLLDSPKVHGRSCDELPWHQCRKGCMPGLSCSIPAVAAELDRLIGWSIRRDLLEILHRHC
jgi:hypothetical protein